MSGRVLVKDGEGQLCMTWVRTSEAVYMRCGDGGEDISDVDSSR